MHEDFLSLSTVAVQASLPEGLNFPYPKPWFGAPKTRVPRFLYRLSLGARASLLCPNAARSEPYVGRAATATPTCDCAPSANLGATLVFATAIGKWPYGIGQRSDLSRGDVSAATSAAPAGAREEGRHPQQASTRGLQRIAQLANQMSCREQPALVALTVGWVKLTPLPAPCQGLSQGSRVLSSA